MSTQMLINGLQASINLPQAPKGKGVHSLPPYDVRNVYKVDDYPACPGNWMHGSSKAASYFLPVEEGRHLWLDFNSNWNHSHHVAIVLSVQGINPITGLPTRSLRLEQYRDKCIIHDTAFKSDRFCENCNNNVPGDYDGKPISNFPAKWPPQNYMTTVSQQHNQLWIDGWRADDGTIRGFLITSEMMRGVAEQIIGEDRVWAIGIAFYLSKEPKPYSPPRMTTHSLYSGQYTSTQLSKDSYFRCASMSVNNSMPMSSSSSMCSSSNNADSEARIMASLRTALYAPDSSQLLPPPPPPPPSPSFDDLYAPKAASINQPMAEVEVQKLEIGAGAKIEQELCRLDPNDPSYYKDEPEGLIYINYCAKSDFDKIISTGMADRTKSGEGFLSGLKTGN